MLSELSPELAEHTRATAHGVRAELATGPTRRAAAPPEQCRAARGPGGGGGRPRLRAAVAGTHPRVRAEEVEVSPGARYQYLHASLRELARREPTFALHVHVAVPDAELAVRALDGMRAHIPVLLALAENSPFTRGRTAGWRRRARRSSSRSRALGIPRAFDSAAYAEVIDVLMRCVAHRSRRSARWTWRSQPSSARSRCA